MGKKFFFKLVLLLISTAVALAIMEIVIRQALPFYDPRRQIVFKMMPEYNNAAIGPKNERVRQRTPKGDYDIWVYFNQYGFRDPKDLAESTADDWFAVGDSFTFGWGLPVEVRFTDQVEKKLGIRIFNIAGPVDLDEYIGAIHYARDQGAVISNLLVGICMNNDLKNYRAEEKPLLAVYGDRKPWKARARAWLQSHSAIYLLCSFELQRIPALRRLFERLGIARDVRELTLQNIYDEEVIDSSADKARQIAELVAPERTWFILIPSLSIWIGEDPQMERRIHIEFAQRLRERGLQVIDLLPAFDSDVNPRSRYFATDPHWNESGHSLAAEAIAAALQGK